MNQLKNKNRSLLTILMLGCFMVVHLVMSSSAFAGAPAKNAYSATLTDIGATLQPDGSWQAIGTTAVTLTSGGLAVTQYTITILGTSTVAAGEVTAVQISDGTSTWSATGAYGPGSAVACTGPSATPVDASTMTISLQLAASSAGKTVGIEMTTENGGNNQGLPASGTLHNIAAPATAPVLTSPTATTIAATTATLGANVTSDGGAAITARGTVWGTAAAPTGNQLATTGTTGVFTQARTGLTAQTRIFYRGYATNSIGTAYSPDGSFYTEPATQASTVNFTSVTSTSMTVNWTRGSGGVGGGVIVVMKASTAVDATPADGTYTGYTANAAFGGGTAITANNFVVFKGTGTSVAVTGLNPTTTYHVAVFEFAGQIDTSGVNLGTNYKLTPATGSQATPAAPVDTLSVTANTAVASSAAPLATNVQMQYLQVDSNNGDNGNVVITSVTVDDLGTVGATDITNLKIHIDADNNFGNGVLDTVTQAGFNASSTVVSLVAMTAATRTVTNGTSKYIWITYDLAAAADGKTVQSSVTSIAVDAPDNGATGTWNSNIISVASGPVSTLADCAGCHNYPPVDSASRNATTGNFIGDHDKHSAYTCATCHITPATETSIDFAHRTGQLNMDSGNIGVGADNGTYSKGATFAQSNSPTYGTCSNVDCHNNAVTPQWGVGTTACNTCHALPPATNAHAAHYTAKGWAANNSNCTVCHPDNTAGHSDVTDNSVTVNAGLGPAGTSPAITCSTTSTGCHNEKTTPAWNSTNIACTSCHTAGGAAAGDPTSGLHATTNLTDHDGTLTGGTGLACEKCHTASPSNLHFNGTVNNGGTATFAWNTANIPAGYNRTSDFCAAVCHTDSGTWNREWTGVTDAAWAYANDAATNAVCGNCHGSFFTGWNIIGNTSHDNPDAGNDPDTLATSKASHSECSTCHAWGHSTYSTGAKHENNFLETNSTLGYDNAAPDATCATNCHGGLTLTMKSDSGWTDAALAGDGVTCGGCHTGGVTTATASGAHNAHGATAALLAANPGSVAICIECHGNDGTGATHNNGSVNFTNVNYDALRTIVTGTCVTSSCHNYDPNVAIPTKDRSTAWNTTALACDDCHYYNAAPTSDGNTAHARPLSTSHGDHFTAGKTCAQCHGVDPAAGDTAHINGGTTANADKATALQNEATISFTGTTTYTFEDTGNTCYSATNNGLGCHATAGAAGAADATRPDWDVAFASIACTNCHTNTTTAAVNPTSGLHNVTPTVSGQRHDATVTGGCAACHSSVPVAGTHKDGVFDGGNGQTTAMGLAAFYTQTANDTGTCATTACHLSFSDAWAHKWVSTAGYYTTNTSACEGCHGDQTSGFNAGVDHRNRGPHTDGAVYGCAPCHVLEAATNNYTFTWSTNDWGGTSKHGNSTIEVNSVGTYLTTTNLCDACHKSVDGIHNFVDTGWPVANLVGDSISAGHGVGANCVSCHDGMTQGTRRDVGLEFNLTMQHGTNAPTNADCEKCHLETSGPDSVIQLKVWNADNTTFTTANYSSADLATANSHCVSCHDATRGVTVGGLSPPARSMANYTSATTYNNHNFAAVTGAVVPQMAKAISPHGNPNGNQLKGAESTVTTAMGCLHCHPSHGSGTASKTATADAIGAALTAKMLGGKPSEFAGIGYDYTSEGALSDPALCWGCHDNKGVTDYYGDTTTGHWNTGGIWKSPTFAYKTGKGGVLSVHVADKVDGGVASDAAASVVCTTCHDVHGSPTVAQFWSPALKGRWLTSPYYEDRAPPAKASGTNGLYAWANADSGARSAADALSPRAAIETGTLWAPKEIGGGYGVVGTQNGAWGYFIDANTFGMSAYRAYTGGAVTQRYMSDFDATAANITTFGGLCMANCHTAANIEARTTWTGHNPVVPGFGGGDAATDLFNVNGTTIPSTTAKVRNQMVGQGWYNNTDWGQNLFATEPAPGERQGGDAGAVDGKTYSHSKAFSYGVNPITAAAQTGYHQFPCAKCHTPHASVLPVLMRTNCLNTAQSGYEWRMAAEANNCHRVEDSTAPFIGSGDPYPGTGYPATHGGATNGGWNAVTPW